MTPLTDQRPPLLAKTTRESQTGCLIWKGWLVRGRTYRAKTARTARRAAWEASRGPVAPGVEVVRCARSERCINPDHLVLLGRPDPGARNRAKTHCPRGHPYAGANLYTYEYVPGRRFRLCRACTVQRGKTWWAWARIAPRAASRRPGKLTAQQVQAIREAPRTHGSGRVLAVHYGVSPSSICRIRRMTSAT